jgi:hypothetical protein
VLRQKVKSMSREIWIQVADRSQKLLYDYALCPGCEDVTLVKMIPHNTF